MMANLHQQPCSLRWFFIFSCGAAGPVFGRNVGQLASTALLVAMVLFLLLWCGGPVFWPKCWPTCINSLDRCDGSSYFLVVRRPRFLAEMLAHLHQQPCSLRWFFFFSCGAVGPFFGRNVGQLASTALIVAMVLLIFLLCGRPVFWPKCWPTCINSLARCDGSSSSRVVRWAPFLAEMIANLHKQPCSLPWFFFFSCNAVGKLFGRNVGQLASLAGAFNFEAVFPLLPRPITALLPSRARSIWRPCYPCYPGQ